MHCRKRRNLANRQYCLALQKDWSKHDIKKRNPLCREHAASTVPMQTIRFLELLTVTHRLHDRMKNHDIGLKQHNMTLWKD